MNEKYTKEMLITTGMCDNTGYLGVAQCFDQCMDIATVHATFLGLSMHELSPKHLFWLAVRTKIKFCRPVYLEDKVSFTTWPEPPERLRCNRSYLMEHDGVPVFMARTEWALLNTEDNTLTRGDEVFPAELTYPTPAVFDDAFRRVRDNFGDIEPYASYTVRSTDIDLGKHMNNAAYIRALMGTFSTQEQTSMHIKELDVRYVTPTYEGQTICFQRRDVDTGIELRASVEGKTVLLVSMVLGE